MDFFKNVSIVIPYFNSSKYLYRTKFSINDYLNRNDVEIIFIDDASDNEESELLVNFISLLNSNNIQYFKNEFNVGASKSRQYGVKRASGKYVAFLDSDDAWAPNKLDYQFDIMEKNNIAITGCLTRLILNENLNINFFEKRKLLYKFKIVGFNHFLFKNYFSTPSVMVLREAILENNFSNEFRYSEDYECWRRILIKYNGAIIEDLGIFSFKHSYISNEGLSSNVLLMSKFELVGLFNIFYNSRVDFKYKLLLPIALSFSCMKSLKRLFFYYLKSLK
ncbi:hypothetical protein B9T33_09755 [Acinetobacter sp. ANC 5054]|uniref:glycosyltransferase family 2 protein n=1 Tax=Acinetobacter sp. ANC 5054 TaxID=1977877 RepID=UPI000A3568BA|nr:glycosyltransferase family 2 protein [Acinetobacter sp. ANC 5054]OTG80192.1 hypothetical protein B9T33_09755 [Acinetobacter sp. ANC 5054]